MCRRGSVFENARWEMLDESFAEMEEEFESRSKRKSGHATRQIRSEKSLFEFVR